MAKVKNGVTYIGGSDSASTVTEYVWKTYEIGPWNMDANAQINIPHGLSATECKTIISIGGNIRNDANTVYHNLPIQTDGTIVLDVFIVGGIDSSIIIVYRSAGGAYDNINYDSTAFNRGTVAILYKPD